MTLLGCSTSDDAPASRTRAGSVTSPTSIARSAPVDSPGLTAENPSDSPLPSLQDLIGAPANGRIIHSTPVGGEAGFVRQEVLYRSGSNRISGLLTVPEGRGPFPAVVINHGYVPPASYRTGQGFQRESAALAEAGYVALQTDYRGYANSDGTPALDRESWIGYTEDAVNAVSTLRGLPVVDGRRIAMIGRSVGGGVTMNVLVTHPGLVKAAVLLSPVSSSFADNLPILSLGRTMRSSAQSKPEPHLLRHWRRPIETCHLGRTSTR